MYEKIVVPLDGSKLAEAALPYAEELAAKMSSDIILLTVLESDDIHEYEKQQKYAKKIVQVTKYHAEKYFDNGADEAIKIEKKMRNYEREGRWSHAAELADKAGLEGRAKENYKKAGYDM